MTAAVKRVIERVRAAVASERNVGERELLEELVAEAEGWRMRLNEIEDEESDE